MKTIPTDEALHILASGLPLENAIVTDPLDMRKLGPEVTVKVVIRNCKIHDLDSASVAYHSEFLIESCLVVNCAFNYSTFDLGADIRDSVFENYVDFEAGPHNKGTFVMERNSFDGFVNFFDCVFEGPVIIKENNFRRGSNLLGNKGESYEVKFDTLAVVESNGGIIDLDGEGNKQTNVIYFNPETGKSFNTFP